MNDTDPRISTKMMEMIQQKSPEERLSMGCSMYDFSKQLVISSILREKPHLSQTELRRELFLRFYEHEFDAKRRDKVAEYFLRVRND